MIENGILESIKKTEAYAKMVEILDEDMVHKMLQDNDKNNTTPVCCYRCTERDTCEVYKIVPWSMVCSDFTTKKKNIMKSQEAIANLNRIYGMVSPDIQRSLDMAIKALEEKEDSVNENTNKNTV